MEEKVNAGEVDSRKRIREDPVSDEDHDFKCPRLEMDVSKSRQSTLINENILDILDDIDVEDNVDEADTAVQGLDSVIKSFEEEIVSVPKPDLWYLLEASDDELGLPPSFASSGDEQSAGAGESTTGEGGYAALGNLGLDVDMNGYGGFEFGVGGDLASEVNSSDGDCLLFDGLFNNGHVEPIEESVEISDPL